MTAMVLEMRLFKRFSRLSILAFSGAQFTTTTSDMGIFVNQAGDAVLPVMAWECSIDNVVYNDDGSLEAESAGPSITFAGAALVSVVAAASLLM